ncbi:MAG TPA: hypothetical protein VLG12_04145 [Candidatus Saccharimonadales bacterium]|nr:hypothetical protein [Candidatus Saccharimonadales bacterium]
MLDQFSDIEQQSKGFEKAGVLIKDLAVAMRKDLRKTNKTPQYELREFID